MSRYLSRFLLGSWRVVDAASQLPLDGEFDSLKAADDERDRLDRRDRESDNVVDRDDEVRRNAQGVAR